MSGDVRMVALCPWATAGCIIFLTPFGSLHSCFGGRGSRDRRVYHIGESMHTSPRSILPLASCEIPATPARSGTSLSYHDTSITFSSSSFLAQMTLPSFLPIPSFLSRIQAIQLVPSIKAASCRLLHTFFLFIRCGLLHTY